jgi:hypothetical protein
VSLLAVAPVRTLPMRVPGLVMMHPGVGVLVHLVCVAVSLAF